MIEQVKEVVKAASKLMLVKEKIITQKGNESNFVTNADVNVQKYLTEKLQEVLPGSVVFGEENETNPKDGENIWIVDPIDGTSNFIRDLGLSAISVGLMTQGELSMGVIYQPYRDEMYWAEKGKGAFLNGKQIHVSERDFRHSHLCSAMSLYDKSLAKPCFNIIEKVYHETDDLRRLGSAATELAYLAAGRVELYFEIRLSAWDVAAAIPIIREAGGYVECLYQDTLPLDKPHALIAANSEENFAKLKRIVTEELTEMPY